MMNIASTKERFLSVYKYKIELHAHTNPVSSCGQLTPSELVEAYHKKGYSAIVVSNHFNSYNASRFPECDKEQFIDLYMKDIIDTEIAAKEYGIKIFHGAELRFDENANDYLIFGVDRDILSVCYDYFPTDLATFRKEVTLPKSILVQAHPFRNGMTEMPPELLDGFETFNMHPGHNSAVALAVRHAYDSGIKIQTAGSDFHEMKHLACAAIRTKCIPKDSFALAKLLKSGDYLIEIGENSIVFP